MERVNEKELRTMISVQLRCMPKWQRRKAELQLSQDIDQAVDLLVDRVFKDMIVVRPSLAMRGTQMEAGKFGQTEPWPLGLAAE